jgi:uncharacterized SAM-binding protein YcdF (DUF218 family)
MELIELWLSPTGLLAVLFAVGLGASAIRRRSPLGRRLLCTGAGLYLLFVMTPLAEVVYLGLERCCPPMLAPDPSVRTVVVLAGYGEDLTFLPITSRLTGEVIPRLAEGIRLYRELPTARLVLAGGVAHRGDRPVAEQMAEFARAMGVPQQDIVIEGRSATTYENMLELKPIVGAAPFLLVTSSAEMRRAAAVARKLGMYALPAPTSIWASRYYPAGMSWLKFVRKAIGDIGYPKAHRLTYLQRAHHEYAGYMWYWLLGRV